MKRFLDFIIALSLLVTLLPLLVTVSLVLLVVQGLPILFIQQRVGKNGNLFDLYKFRTMEQDAHLELQVTVGLTDPRITPFGRWLRRYKIDEFPQLVNVIKGDMSMVGPRPELEKYVDQSAELQRRALSVKPGITDYASLHFSNDNEMLMGSDSPESTYINTIIPRKLELNMTYIKNPSIVNYFKVIILTVYRVFLRRRA